MNEKTVHKVVLTGGPCAGKTSGQKYLTRFFENLGWKVLAVPETATFLIGTAGIPFELLNSDTKLIFQENLLLTMLAVEKTNCDLAESVPQENVLVIFDRGTMDNCAYVERDIWLEMLQRNHLNEVSLRDGRYDQVVHLATVADGAEQFYTFDTNSCRWENVDQALKSDKITRQAWIGHPCIDYIGNDYESFEMKMRKLVQVVCDRVGVDCGNTLMENTRKRKWLIEEIDNRFASSPIQEFDVVHNFLISPESNKFLSMRKRGQNGYWNYTLRTAVNICGKFAKKRDHITEEVYNALLTQRDTNHATIVKKQWCFLFEGRYFRIDIYEKPIFNRVLDSNPQLITLETYTADEHPQLPDFVTIKSDVTDDPDLSMFRLSLICKSG